MAVATALYLERLDYFVNLNGITFTLKEQMQKAQTIDNSIKANLKKTGYEL